MTNAQAKQLVMDGLTLRKQRKQAAEQEAKMEAYEKEMISFCNGHYASAKESRAKEAERTMALAEEAFRREEERSRYIEQRKLEREQMRMEMERDATAMDALRRFVFFCLMTALVTVWTPFPWWAAVALIVGNTAIMAAYIFRVYFPVQ